MLSVCVISLCSALPATEMNELKERLHKESMFDIRLPYSEPGMVEKIVKCHENLSEIENYHGKDEISNKEYIIYKENAFRD